MNVITVLWAAACLYVALYVFYHLHHRRLLQRQRAHQLGWLREELRTRRCSTGDPAAPGKIGSGVPVLTIHQVTGQAYCVTHHRAPLGVSAERVTQILSLYVCAASLETGVGVDDLLEAARAYIHNPNTIIHEQL